MDFRQHQFIEKQKSEIKKLGEDQTYRDAFDFKESLRDIQSLYFNEFQEEIVPSEFQKLIKYALTQFKMDDIATQNVEPFAIYYQNLQQLLNALIKKYPNTPVNTCDIEPDLQKLLENQSKIQFSAEIFADELYNSIYGHAYNIKDTFRTVNNAIGILINEKTLPLDYPRINTLITISGAMQPDVIKNQKIFDNYTKSHADIDDNLFDLLGYNYQKQTVKAAVDEPLSTPLPNLNLNPQKITYENLLQFINDDLNHPS